MGEVVLMPHQVVQGAERWRDAAELLEKTSTLLADETLDGLGPRVQPAATAFLVAWSGYASEGASIAEGYGEGMDLVVADMSRTDDEAQQLFESIDPQVGEDR